MKENTQRKGRRGITLAELLVSVGMFSAISAITFVMYGNARDTIDRSTQRMTSAGKARAALSRVETLLSSAYVPPISGVTRAFQQPNPPYAPGAPAPTVGDPLLPLRQNSSVVPDGNDSIVFFAPGDLINNTGQLYPVSNKSKVYSSNCGVRLYELRLDQGSYDVDRAASYQPGQPVTGNAPPLILRRLVLRELYCQDTPTSPFAYNSSPLNGFNGFSYLIPGPSPDNPSGNGFVASPAPAIPVNYPASTPTKVIARGLSDVRFKIPPAGGSVQVTVYAQDREGTLNSARAKQIHTTSLSTNVYYLAGH